MIDNKRIAKNTLLLYLRMFLLMGISLYTSRIVLETLGVEDFGVYNIVGSIIVLFSFINNALTAATRRFINFNLGKNNPQESAKAFSASLTIHFIICIILIIISESIGLWFLNTQLNIPENRMYAANWVYQFSILSACIGIVGAPYESTIVAYEKMSVYSYLSIIEGVFKLIIVYMLVICTTDKLIFYSALILQPELSYLQVSVHGRQADAKSDCILFRLEPFRSDRLYRIYLRTQYDHQHLLRSTAQCRHRNCPTSQQCYI